MDNIQGLTSSSHSDMGSSKKICILIFNDDYICQNLVSEVLKHCTYEVLHIGSTMDALSEIRRRNESINLVLTNMNRLKTKGAEIIQVIEKELNLSICYILPGNMEYDTRGEECNVSLYIVNFSDINEMKWLWQSALEKEKAKTAGSSSIQNEASVDGETGNGHHDGETEESRERSGGGETRKKPRLSWTPEMHQKFVDAINNLGFEKAVPKKIVEYMNVPGLTREQVASHLQKYRMNMRKGQEYSADSFYNVTRPFYGNSYPCSLNFNPFQSSTSSVFATSLGQSYNLQTNMSTTVPQQNMFPRNHIFTPQRMNPNGFINRNNDMLPSAAIENGHSSSGSVSSSTWDPRFKFVGFRVVNDELRFGEKTSITSTEISAVSLQQQPANAESNSLPIIQQESVPPAVIEINSFGGEDDISALLDATDIAANHPEGLWDIDDDFNDVLSSL